MTDVFWGGFIKQSSARAAGGFMFKVPGKRGLVKVKPSETRESMTRKLRRKKMEDLSKKTDRGLLYASLGATGAGGLALSALDKDKK